MPPTRLLGNRDFRLLWSAQALTTTGTLSAMVALPLLVLHQTGSAAVAGLVGFAVLAAAALATLPGGRVADRYDRRAVLVCCAGGSAISTGLLALAVHVDAATIPVVLLLTVLRGALAGAFGAAGAAALPHVVPPAQLPTALATNTARLAAAALVGPAPAGALFGVSPELPFWAAAVALLVATACVMAIRTPLPAPAGTGPSGLTTGLVFLWRDGVLRRITLVGTAHNAVFSAVPLLLVVIGLRQHDSGLSIGLVYTATGVGSLVGALAATALSRRLPPRRALLITCWVPAVLLALAAISPSLESLAVALTAGCLVSPPADAVLTSVRVVRTPDALQGRTQAAVGLVGMCATPLGPPAAGLLLDHVDVGVALLVLATSLAALAVVATLSPQLRHVPAPGGPDA
ncbi:MFS family permease [Saccharothrix tamanrassetensis]|uniref:MFS family permease n=1 Tax=Saccharothrix tamanrassetensis TaxID=1051531 RepID=A0A841CW52_9PSEU|nr:MFS transporter [Saccharothrix tamanrassetensis]MBB5959606.1 MFS family permease [Saccharothrix tamanrassetensis]